MGVKVIIQRWAKRFALWLLKTFNRDYFDYIQSLIRADILAGIERVNPSDTPFYSPKPLRTGEPDKEWLTDSVARDEAD